MKKLLSLVLIFIVIITLAACDQFEPPPEPVVEKKCIPKPEEGGFDFYATNTESGIGTLVQKYQLKTDWGDVEIPDKIFEYTVLGVYKELCFNIVDGEIDEFTGAVLTDIAQPEPPTVEVEVEVEVIREVEVEVIVIEEVQTHDLIDPDTWVATNHTVYYYFVQENVVHLVYVDGQDMYTLTIIFEPSFAFSDKVMIASVVHMNLGIYQGGRVVETELTETEFDTIEEYVDNFILTKTLQDVKDLYDPPVEEES